MANARGVGPATANTALPGTTCVITLNGTTLGNALVIGVTWYDGDGPHIISSALIPGETVVLSAASKVSDPSNQETGQIAYVKALASGGTKVLTVTFDGLTYGGGAMLEYSGLDPSSQPDAVITQSNNDADGSDTCNTNITTITDNALIVGMGSNNGAQPTAGATYTIWGTTPIPPASGSGYGTGTEDKLDAGAAGSKNVLFAGGIFGPAYLSVVAFKTASGAGAYDAATFQAMLMQTQGGAAMIGRACRGVYG